MSATLHVREATQADWPQALELIASVFVGEGFVSRERNDRGCRREVLESGGTVLTAVDDAKPARVLGVVVLAHKGGPLNLLARDAEAEFRMLAVDPKGRGRGIGERLVRACIERGSRPPLSARAIVLWTQPTMHAAQRLYERMGFIRVPNRDAVMPPGSEGAAGLITRERWAYRLEIGDPAGAHATPWSP
ncbi:MAG: N-acetyltransferase [Planctomycetota bacterium]